MIKRLKKELIGGLLAGLSLALIGSGCASTPDASTFKKVIQRPLQGRVNGNDWVYQHAYLDPTMETVKETDYVFVFLNYVPEDPCPVLNKEDPAPTVMIAAPKRKRRKPMRLRGRSGRSLVFQKVTDEGLEAITAARGQFNITDISKREVEGEIWARHSDGNYVNGYFTAKVCKYEDIREMEAEWNAY